MALCAAHRSQRLLFFFGRHVWNSGAPQLEPAGITVSSDVLTIYAPQALVDFAKAHPEITTNDELVRLIREAKLNVWFAIVGRLYQANGTFADVSASYRPGERPECFATTPQGRPAHALRGIAQGPVPPIGLHEHRDSGN